MYLTPEQIKGRLKNQNLHEEDMRMIIDEISKIDLGDDVTFEIKEVFHIMDEMEYPGIRFAMNAMMGKLMTPMKIDISTGDVITPHAVEYEYKLMLEERSIGLWAYNLETELAEKLQTILTRGVLNTRIVKRRIGRGANNELISSMTAR